jgi:hypothetical protein
MDVKKLKTALAAYLPEVRTDAIPPTEIEDPQTCETTGSLYWDCSRLTCRIQ